MSNIDLTKLFSNRATITSPVDSNITLNKPQKREIFFSDIKNDLTINHSNGDILNSVKTDDDLAIIVNEESILNSLRNIMTTKFFSRLLNPEMNFDLRDYLFENITEHKAYFIGYDICTNLPLYEPRVQIKNMKVIAYYNKNMYSINLNIYIPSIDKNVKLSAILNSDGFVFD